MSDRGWLAVQNIALVFAIAASVMCLSIYGCGDDMSDYDRRVIDKLEQKIDAIHRVVVGSKP